MRRTAAAVAVMLVVASCTSAAPSPSATAPAAPGIGQPGPSASAAGAPQGLASNIQDLSTGLINPGTGRTFSVPYRDLAPAVKLITVTGDPEQGPVTVTGAPGAIPDAARAGGNPQRPLRVRITSLEWDSETCVPLGANGSFTGQLRVGPGTTLGIDVVPPDNCEGSRNESGSTALVRVPDGVPVGAPNGAFRISGFDGELVGPPGQGFKWIAEGEASGPAPFVRFRFPDGPPPTCQRLRLLVNKLFDAQGTYVTQVNANISGPVLTPTGMPIETDQGYRYYWSLATPAPDRCIAQGARFDLSSWTSGLDPGWYRARIVFYTPQGAGGSLGTIADLFPGLNDQDSQSAWSGGHTLEQDIGLGYLPLTNVGTAATPRIPATLFNDDASWGSGGIRGIVANEDAGRFGLGSRVATPAPFIASPHDPLTGRRVKYLLEPFFPTLDYVDFDYVLPQAPLIPLDNTGTLSVALTTPDGKTQQLAQNAPLTQAFLSGTSTRDYQIETTFHGPGRTLGVTTGLPSLFVDFTQYGKHTVTLSGSIRSIWGQELQIKGTYDFTVAEPLELGLGTFQGTPLDVGQEMSPVVVVRPGVPADVEIAVDHYVDGDAAKKQHFATSGTADRWGYFVGKDAWRPAAPGEYDVRVTASWKDPADGTLWMGIRSGVSIVATPSSPLIAHGERNARLQNIAHDGVLRTWFFTKALDPKCGEAACDPIVDVNARSVWVYPYFRGDVAWVVDNSPILPTLTLEDPTGVLRRLAPQVAALNSWPVEGPPADTSDMLRLENHTTAGRGASGHPGTVDSWAYSYRTSVHANGVNIDAAASEEHSVHNHWYGHETFNCQISLPCFNAWQDPRPGTTNDPDRNGDEEGDVKFLFGGIVVKSAQGQQFVSYASTSIITPEAIQLTAGNPPTYTFRDPKGNRICPPYQGLVGGVATCGPQVTIAGKAYDLFVVPTGTRPGQVLDPGEKFVFSGQVSPTLDVAYRITVTSPSGKQQTFDGRASSIGYIDSKDKAVTVTEPGVYTVQVALTQDRPVPSTGTAPATPIVADGKTSQPTYGGPLSAIMGSPDSTYRFVVADPADAPIVTDITDRQNQAMGTRVPASIAFTFTPPAGTSALRAIVQGRAVTLVDKEMATSGPQRVQLDSDALYKEVPNIVLGSESLDVVFAGVANGKPFARYLNLRGMTAFGGPKATIR